MAKYTKTIEIVCELQFKTMQIGQWFKWSNGAKGQYLGQTLSGTYVCVYSHTKFDKNHAKRNKLQRQFALKYGSK